MNILQFVSATVWKFLFGKNADSLERSVENSDEFMIIDYEPLTSTYCSVPPAHNVALEDGEYNTSSFIMPRKEKAVFLVKFDPSVSQRDAAMDR